MIKWDKKVEDRHMKGTTPFGLVFIRLDREGNITSMYTLFGTTEKHMPDEEWMQDVEGAQLRLEILTEETARLRNWGESLRSKQ